MEQELLTSISHIGTGENEGVSQIEIIYALDPITQFLRIQGIKSGFQ